MQHRYRITMEALHSEKADNAGQSMSFEVENHDDIFAVVRHLESRDDFTPDEARAFGVGLKLFSEVMLKNRTMPLFASFLPHFGDFMKQLKKG